MASEARRRAELELGTASKGTIEATGIVARDAIAPEPLLVDVRGLAALLNVSRSFVHKLRVTGRLPASVEVGRCRRWRIEEIRAWLSAGAPSRDRWEATRKVQR